QPWPTRDKQEESYRLGSIACMASPIKRTREWPFFGCKGSWHRVRPARGGVELTRVWEQYMSEPCSRATICLLENVGSIPKGGFRGSGVQFGGPMCCHVALYQIPLLRHGPGLDIRGALVRRDGICEEARRDGFVDV